VFEDWVVVRAVMMMQGPVCELVCLHSQQWQNPMVGHTSRADLTSLTTGRYLSFACYILVSKKKIAQFSFVSLFAISFAAAAETEGRRRLISKSFHHQLKYHNKQPLVGKWSSHAPALCR